MEDFAALLVAAREKTGMTQAQVALAAGLTPSYLSFIENRKKPPPSEDVCRRLADVLKVPARRLIEVAHLERAPSSLKKRVRSLSHSLKRERRSRRRILESLLSPFLFRGPPGWIEGALDTIGINPKRRRRMREALAAVGRHHQDRAAEVARIVEELSERDRDLLLGALPQLLQEQAPTPRADPAATGGPEEPAEGAKGAERGTAPASGAPLGAHDTPLFYAPPPREQLPDAPYLLEVAPDMAGAAPEGAGVEAGDRLLVDPSLEPRCGDLVVERTPGGARLRRVVAEGGGFRLEGDPGGRPGTPAAPDPPAPKGDAAAARASAPLDDEGLRRRLAATGAGTVIEIRRPLRRG